MDYQDIARKIFSRSKYVASESDVKRLATNMVLLEKRGLGKLNKRLDDARKHTKIFETIAEHNFAMLLVSRHGTTTPISYEPDMEGQRPPDFKVEIENITYWIQMKDLSKLERENRQEKLIQKIKEKAKGIKVSKFFSCTLSDDFKEICLSELIEFITDKASTATENERFLFTGCENNQKAEIAFWSADNIEALTLGYGGDLEVLNITGLSKEQIKQSLLNAAGAFTWDLDERNINCAVIEADSEEDIDICDALFGTEYDIGNSSQGHVGWSRKEDGLFSDPDFSKKIAGVITIKRKGERDEEISALSPEEVVSRLSPDEKEIFSNMTPEEIKVALEWKEPGPIADYYMILYMNKKFKHLLEGMKKLLNFDKVVYYNMRPPMGDGDFKLSD